MGNTLDYFTADAVRPMPYDVKVFWRRIKLGVAIAAAVIVWSKATRFDPMDAFGLMAFLLGLSGIFVVIICLVIHVALLLHRHSVGTLLNRLIKSPPIAMLLLFALISVSMFTSALPRLGFAASRPFLESLANDVAAGRSVSTPRVCGIFVIRHVRREPNGTPGLYTDWSKDGWSGLIRHPTTGRVDHVNSNNGVGPKLPDGWEWVSED